MNRAGPAAFAALMLGTGLITSAVASEHNEGVCAARDSGKVDVVGSQPTVTVNAPDGFLVSSYCVKAGSIRQGDGPVYVDIDPVASVTFGHPSGKDVSHWSASFTPVPVVEPPAEEPPAEEPPAEEPPAEEPPAEEPPAPVDLPPVENLAPPVPPVVHVDNGHPIGTPAWRAANPSAVVELG